VFKIGDRVMCIRNGSFHGGDVLIGDFCTVGYNQGKYDENIYVRFDRHGSDYTLLASEVRLIGRGGKAFL
jgi:hypothetical protein